MVPPARAGAGSHGPERGSRPLNTDTLPRPACSPEPHATATANEPKHA